MRSQIGQQMIVGLNGHTLEKEEAKFIVENNIGGVILFARNVASPEQVRNLCAEVQSLRHRTPDKAPLFISIDMEGGRVLRLKQPPFTPWPALASVGKIGSTSVAFQFAHSMGVELRALGINLDYAPCVDIFSNPANTVIGDRALASDVETVTKLGSALVRGYIKSNVIPCAKHFPGHGATLLDSHHALPVENRTREELDSFELEPFKKVFRARLEMVMVAHILFAKIDPEWPASLSEVFLKKILREDLRFRGLIITDDLDMKALRNHHTPEQIAVRALNAGCNILLYCNEPESPRAALVAIEQALAKGALPKATIENNYKQVMQLKAGALSSPDPLPIEEMKKIVGQRDHLRLAEAILAGSVPADLLSQQA